MNVAFIGVVLTVVIGATRTGRTLARLSEFAVAEGTASRSPARAHDADGALWASFAARAWILVGIVFLMTVKPGMEASLTAMAVAIAAGLLFAFGALRGRTSRVSRDASRAAQ
jgi:hypothetical protein